MDKNHMNETEEFVDLELTYEDLKCSANQVETEESNAVKSAVDQKYKAACVKQSETLYQVKNAALQQKRELEQIEELPAINKRKKIPLEEKHSLEVKSDYKNKYNKLVNLKDNLFKEVNQLDEIHNDKVEIIKIKETQEQGIQSQLESEILSEPLTQILETYDTYASYESEVKTLKQQLNKILASINGINSQLKHKEESIKENEAERDKLEIEHKKLKEQYDQLELNYNMLQTDKNQCEDKIAELEKEEDNLEFVKLFFKSIDQ